MHIFILIPQQICYNLAFFFILTLLLKRLNQIQKQIPLQILTFFFLKFLQFYILNNHIFGLLIFQIKSFPNTLLNILNLLRKHKNPMLQHFNFKLINAPLFKKLRNILQIPLQKFQIIAQIALKHILLVRIIPLRRID